MANMTETTIWQPNINQVEQDEFITGGANGSINQSCSQIADRTQWLRQQFATIQAKLDALAKANTPTNPTTTSTEGNDE